MKSEKEEQLCIKLSAKTMRALRRAFESCLESEKELAGVFEVSNAPGCTLLSFADAQHGYEGGDWIASSTEDAPFIRLSLVKASVQRMLALL